MEFVYLSFKFFDEKIFYLLFRYDFLSYFEI